MTKEEIKTKIHELELTLTGNMLEDMEVKDKIHKLNMDLNGISPTCSLGEECENCGS